jgi:hypothetical protein
VPSENLVSSSYAQSASARPTCIDFRGIAVTYVPNAGINDIAMATYVNNAPVVFYNPNVVATVSAPTAAFFSAHECGHHVLGHAVRDIPFSREQEADCFAITELVRQGMFGETEIRIVQNELAAFGRADWTHLPGPQRAINLRACLETKPTPRRGRGDDSCDYANDGTCDEPTVCRVGTDATDCGAGSTPPPPRRAADSCEYANDGACDEPTVCPAGTDATDCGNRTPIARPGRDSCEYANDGTCDEPRVCPRGTDTTDCNQASRPPRPTSGTNSCEYAFDGACDEPDVCDPGTDTSDCRAQHTPTPRRAGVQVCQTPYGSCAMVIRGFAGSSCFCQVGYNSVQGLIVEH